MRSLPLALAATCLAGLLSSEVTALETLIVSGQVDPGVGEQRTRAELQWLHTDEQGHWNAGVGTSEAGQATWLLATLGGSRVLDDRWRLSARLQAGSGREDGSAFDYGTAALGVTHSLRPGRIFLEAEILAFEAGRSRGKLARGGGLLVLGPQFTVNASYTVSIGGSDRVSFISTRFDLQRNGPSPFLGLTVGETVPALLDPSALHARATEYRQVFLGTRLPGRRMTLDLAVEFEEVGPSERAAVKLAVQVPWRPAVYLSNQGSRRR